MQLIEQTFVVRRLEALLTASESGFRSAFQHFQDALTLAFRKEEEDMLLIDYPARDTHMVEHQKLLQLLWRISARMHYDGAAAGADMVNMLPHCLLEHMIKVDLPLQQALGSPSACSPR